ncbi:MAG: tRNA (adenosine(37)-N6)-threonylcarbamoyltransferase complex ATPase subunit type 1 TsaE [Pseudomonadota bacterium]
MLERRNLSQDALHLLAKDIAIACNTGDTIALHGELGAGKTSFARAFIRYLAQNDIEVPSPTFSLVQPYDELPIPVSHYDLYRLGDESELNELGLEETLATSIALIEWPERAGQLLPPTSLHVLIAIDDSDSDRRDVTITGGQDVLERIDQSLSIRSFLHDQRMGHSTRRPLAGDASTRRYETIGGTDPKILMIAPPQPDGPPVRDGLAYSKLAHLAEDIRPFVVIGSALRDAGVRAPAIDGFDVEKGFMLLEDLGRGTILNEDGVPVPDCYVGAGELLAAMHSRSFNQKLSARGLHHELAAYDLSVFKIEAELLLDWYVPAMTGERAGSAMRDDFMGVLEDLWNRLDIENFTILLRDYHSPNIVFDPARQGTDRFGIIDFQDALWGPAAYDVISLVHDARATVPTELGAKIIDAYCARRLDANSQFDVEAFADEAAICTAQRLCKILGIFHRLNERDGKPAYLAHLPRVRNYLEEALRQPVLAPLNDWLLAAGLKDIS